ncbi:MAG TPA: apolipoprotein N-acyltransferase [Actinomycetota bacterium]|nr:apolipoprotein N-acyltransferase [Actinomycetota bacterium]
MSDLRPGLGLRLLICAAAGFALSLAFPPAGIWPLAFVAVAPFIAALGGVRPRQGALLGLAFGITFFGATLYWILLFGELGFVSLVLLSAAAIVVVGALSPLVDRRDWPIRSALGVAALWTVLEWIRGLIPFGGFTWGSVGISQVDDAIILRLASVTGVSGITFVVIAVNALLIATLRGRTARARVVPVLVAAAMVLLPGLIPYPVADGPPVDVAVIQVDTRVPAGTTVAEQDVIVARRHIEQHLTFMSDPDPPDLILWGEGALDPVAARDPTVMAEVTDAIADVGVPTVVGAVLGDPDGRETTSTLVFDGDGAPVARYDKTHLVPFGEYVPFRERLGFIQAIDQIPVDRVPGTSLAPIRVGDVPPFATPICFENAFPAIPRALANGGATFLIVPVNNASYGFTAASDQHLQMSRMRAVEVGRPIVDAAISGVSAVIDTRGRVTGQTTLFETAILRGEIVTSQDRTPYAASGDVVVAISLILFMGIAIAPRRSTAARRTPGPLPATLRTLVILPTFEERATIEQVLRGVLARPEGVDVLVVDDSSPDGTAAIVRAVAAEDPRVRLLERPRRSGLASAYLEGFRIALDEGYHLVVEMDSDLSHDPTELSGLLQGAHAHDLTVGSRYIDGGSVTNWSRSRLALSKAGNRYARFMLGLEVHDATSGYRVYRRDLLETLMANRLASEGYGFQIELVMLADRLGYDLGEVPITFREREHGHSKISRRIVAEALWHVTRWGVAIRFGTAPKT